MPSTPDQTSEAPPALSAFLRGVERRGAVFGELQCGDSDAGDTALAAAMRAFRNRASELPMADWPRRFWALLAATPQLRASMKGAVWPAGTQALGLVEPLPRQALLMRLVAGLDEEEAGSVLNLTPDEYRQALAAACPRDTAGQPDAAAWRGLAETIQLHLRELPPVRLTRLADLREAALKGGRLPPGGRKLAAPRPINAPTTGHRSRGWRWLLAILLLCGLAIAVTWGWQRWQATHGLATDSVSNASQLHAEAEVMQQPLPLEAPAARFDAAFALANHPDAALLLDEQEEVIARDADFFAWYAAGRETVAAKPQAQTQSVDSVGVETSDAQL